MSKILEKIIEAKETIGDEAAIKIAEYYAVKDFDEQGLKGCCPFHNEKTPSFIWNKKDKSFTCFGCGKRLGILDMYIATEGSYKKAVQRLFKEANIKFETDCLSQNKEDYFKNYKYPKEEICENIDIVEKYCLKRGLSKETLKHMNVKQDKGGNVVFELRDVDQNLLAVKYRQSKATKDNGKKMWWQKDADMCHLLYNIDKIDITRPVLIVEGYFDALSVFESGYNNVVSIPSGAEDLNWIEFNYEFLENFNEIILWFDNDRAGQSGLEKAISRLGEYRCKKVSPTKEYEDLVHDYFTQFGSHEIKKTDANNILLSCGKEHVLRLIENAVEIPSKKLKYLMDCDIENIKDIEKTSLGIKGLDDLLYGGLFPCFTIYSGYSGGGKSSIANIASLISPIENGYKAFVFSGELGNGQLADWIVTPLAGYNHIQEITDLTFSDRPFYTATDSAIKAIKDYYRKPIVVYDDEEGLEVSGNALLTEMETAYKKYGCRVFLIDNLMCLSFENLNEDNKWDTQKKFIIRLMNFSKKYKVQVNLILHPKKKGFASKDPTTDDLHGASEIGNLCHRLLWVTKLKPEEAIYNTRIDVIKDRPTQAAGKFCQLYYDEKTRRIYTDLAEQRKTYNWENYTRIKYTKEIDATLIYHHPQEQLPHEMVNAPPF